MRRNQQIHSSDALTFIFKMHSNLPILKNGLAIERRNVERFNELAKRLPISLGLAAFLCPILEFGKSNRQDPNITNSTGLKPFPDGMCFLSDNINTAVGIEHTFHGKNRFLR